MTIDISPQTEARIAEEARRQGLSVDALIETLVNERISVPASPLATDAPTVFTQGLGLFSSPEDTALLDDIVSLAYNERRRPTKEQPLAL